jgi:hypothetical protein
MLTSAFYKGCCLYRLPSGNIKFNFTFTSRTLRSQLSPPSSFKMKMEPCKICRWS